MIPKLPRIRPVGHYWVKLPGEDDWRMARWSGGHFTLIGKPSPLLDREVEAVSNRRLDPPRKVGSNVFS